MNETMQQEKASYQLGLPPMELAETSDQDNTSTKRCLLHPLLQKIIAIVLITLCMAGAYIILSTLLQGLDFGSTEIVIVNQDTPNVTIEQGNIEIFVLIKNKTQAGSNRVKRDVKETMPNSPIDISDDTEDTTDDEFSQVFDGMDDDKVNQAREIIKHDLGKCNENNKEEICKKIVTTIKSLANNVDFGQNPSLNIIADSENHRETDTTLAMKRETSGVIADSEMMLKSTPNLPVEARDSYGYVPEPIAPLIEPASLLPAPLVAYPPVHTPVHNPPEISESCLLAKLLKQHYPQAYIDVSRYAPPQYENHVVPYSRFAQPAHPVSVASIPNNMIHHQDADILMNFLTPHFRTVERTNNSSARESDCDPGSVSCANGEECILERQWCDGRVDCSDVSDESTCSCKSRVDKSRLCDGYFDCPFGEDEMGCYGCSEAAFSCLDLDVNSQGTCFIKEQRCNNVADCPNQRDELDCTLLAPTMHQNALYAISNTEGFLHRNFRGDWYAVCKNPYMWAHEACRRETGLIIRPPIIELVKIDPMLKVNYLNTGEGGMLQASNTCLNNSAVYVTCADLLCGTRLLPATQILRENPEAENHLFGRNKRYLLQNPYFGSYYRRAKRHIPITDPKNNPINSLGIEKDVNLLRYKRTQSRVVGGRPSEAAAWPWMVAMYRDGMFHCGGVVITQTWTMSAAHCMHKYWNNYFEIRVGMLRRFSFSPQESIHKVTHVIVNHKYHKDDMKNDISLLKVAPAVQFSRWVRPICLPNIETAGSDWLWGPAAGTMCTAVGWGATVEHGPDPDHLREVEVPIWPRCKHREDREGKEICAGINEGGRDACQGDSGGPLLCKNPLNPQQWYLAGIVSHGDGCGRKDEPGVYTRVSIFVKWIRHHIFSVNLPTVRPKQECPGFKCLTGMAKCLSLKRVCDKIVDCLGGEDEMNCNTMRTNTPLNDFMLRNPTADSKHIIQTKEAEITPEPADNFVKVTPAAFTEITENDNVSVNRETVESFANTNRKTTRGDMDDSISISLPQNKLESRAFKKDISNAKETDIHENWDDELSTNQNTETTIFIATDNADDNTESVTTRPINEVKDIMESTTTTMQEHDKSQISQDFEVTEPVTKFEAKDFLIDLQETHSETFLHTNQDTTTLSSQVVQDDIKESKTMSILKNNNVDKKTRLPKLTPVKIKRQHLLPKDFECRHIQQTVPYHQRCDRKADCEDGTDEFGCTCSDYLSRFDQHLLCNGIFDCADGQDEMDCYTCPEHHFLCKKSQQCLPNEYVCDDKPQCPMGEDELECYSLTNGENIELDLNGAPKLNLQGFLTKKYNNDWHVVCDENLTMDEHEAAANHICRYLGFSSANRFLVKHINVKEENVLRSNSNEETRNRRNIESRMPVHFAFRTAEDTARHIVINEPQVLKEQCVPNVTKTCMSLYVYCDHALFTDSLDLPNEILFNREANVITHMWPWVAKVFVDGDYKCSGVLVDLSWTLVSHSCLWDSSLSHHLVTVVLGLPNTLLSNNGLYEQSIKVDAKKELYHTKAVLLHLKEPAEYSHMVKPMVVSSSVLDEKPIVCLAIGQDEKNATIGMFLEQTYDNCEPHNRCYMRNQKENVCAPGMSSHHQWAGIISCHTDQGWYPAASFVDRRGECGIGDRIVGSEIGSLKNEIKHFTGRTIPDSNELNSALECEGVRCGRGRCVRLANLCDGVDNCEDRNDELEEACQKKTSVCSKDPFFAGCTCSSGQMKCQNGKCVGKELFKDGRDDCGDGTDEPAHMSCALYLSKVKPARLCDGILHCKDRTDEDPAFCKCFAKKGYKCNKVHSDVDLCVSYDVVCDGVNDCPNGDDEKTCLGMRAPVGTAYGTGQVIVQSHGVWYTKCYTSQSHTKSELEAICKELGFISGHAKLLDAPPNFSQIYNYTMDNFSEVILNTNISVYLRNTNEPLAKAVANDSNENCYPVYIECL